MKASMKGFFRPKNPKKYKGDPNKIIYRSSWELKLLMYIDHNDDIMEYSSEEFFIPYVSPLDNKVHRYFPDVWIKKKNGDIILIEVKPFKYTMPPVKPKKQTKTFITETTQYIINTAKWEAAKNFCSKKKPEWKFLIMTEKELDIR